MNDSIMCTAAKMIKEADGIMIAAANGFSIADGFAILRPSKWFHENFADFKSKYGIQVPIQGIQYPFSDPREFNTFYSRLIKGIHYNKEITPILKTIKEITAAKPAFILTTNSEDRFVQAGYPQKDVFYLEGRMTYTKDHQYIPEDKLDRITSIEQLETAGYPGSQHFLNKMKDLNHFLTDHPRFVILELGVSYNNYFLRPLITQMMENYPYSYTVEFNLQPNFVNPALQKRTLQIAGPLQKNLEILKDMLHSI